MRTELHPIYILHRRHFRETSLILECLSADYGRVGVVARGATRGRKRGGETMQILHKYKIAWTGRGELLTLTALEPLGATLNFTGEALFSGLYINELVMRVTGRHDPNPRLFAIYDQTLKSLAEPEASIEPILRRFEKVLLDACGYGLELTVEVENGEKIDPSRDYVYIVEQGPIHIQSGKPGIVVSGETLLALAGYHELRAPQLIEAKKLMRFVLRHYIGDRPLVSRALFHKPTSDAQSI